MEKRLSVFEERELLLKKWKIEDENKCSKSKRYRKVKKNDE